MKKYLTFILILLSATTSTQASDIYGVKKLKEKDDGSYLVRCDNKNRGTISFENSSEFGEDTEFSGVILCTKIKQKHKPYCEEIYDETPETYDCEWSRSNEKSRCEEMDNWSVEEAAEFLCKD
jgi:hypothetical protein